mmetsp:Transcript_9702/g.25103  ORF Transcript_9702/g.25103 Transcript_9702/m.25103 type:complete len:348 (+) Transcript_9702:187-1230(+)
MARVQHHATVDGIVSIGRGTGNRIALQALPMASAALAFDLAQRSGGTLRTAAAAGLPRDVDFVIDTQLWLVVNNHTYSCGQFMIAARHGVGWRIKSSGCASMDSIAESIKCNCGLQLARKDDDVVSVSMLPHKHHVLHFHSPHEATFERHSVDGGEFHLLGGAFDFVFAPTHQPWMNFCALEESASIFASPDHHRPGEWSAVQYNGHGGDFGELRCNQDHSYQVLFMANGKLVVHPVSGGSALHCKGFRIATYDTSMNTVFMGLPHCAWRDIPLAATPVNLFDQPQHQGTERAYLCDCGEKNRALKLASKPDPKTTAKVLTLDIYRVNFPKRLTGRWENRNINNNNN